MSNAVNDKQQTVWLKIHDNLFRLQQNHQVQEDEKMVQDTRA